MISVMSKLHIKKGDTVYVNSGNCKGQTQEAPIQISKLNPVVDGKAVRSNGKAMNVTVK